MGEINTRMFSNAEPHCVSRKKKACQKISESNRNKQDQADSLKLNNLKTKTLLSD